MKILVFDQFSEPGGAQGMLIDLLKGMRQREWSVLVGLPGSGEVCNRVRALGFEVAPISCGAYSLGRKTPADMWRFVAEIPRLSRQMRQMAERFRPDLIYINGPRLLPGAAFRGLKCPVLFHAHIGVSQGLARRAAGWSLRKLNARVVAVCQAVAAAWRPFVGDERMAVVYNGVAGPAARRTRHRAGAPRIGCIGRIAPEKGQREFLEAAAQIHAKLPDARFVVCGAPLFSDRAAAEYARQVRELARDLPVEFAGWVRDVYAAMDNLDLLLVPSVWEEPNPRVILEACAAGLPVIAFRAGGIPEIIEDGRTGFLCDDAGAMARLALELWNGDPARLNAVACAARERWRLEFTLERWQEQMIAELEKAAG